MSEYSIEELSDVVDTFSKKTFSQLDVYTQFLWSTAFVDPETEPDALSQAELRAERQEELKRGVSKISPDTIKRLYRGAQSTQIEPRYQATLWPFLKALKVAYEKNWETK